MIKRVNLYHLMGLLIVFASSVVSMALVAIMLF